MSLLLDTAEDFTILDKITSTSTFGGYDAVYVDGATIQASIYVMSPQEILAAQASQSKARYTILTSKAVNLQYHDVLRRESDGKIFRITTDGDDEKTPKSAGLNLRKVEAEEWELPRA